MNIHSRHLFLVLLVGSVVVPVLSWAQALQSTPFPFAPGVTAHVDDDRGVGSIADFRCGDNTYDQHEGTDYGVGRGTSAYASSDGTIYAVGRGCPDPGFFGSSCGGGFGNYYGIDTSGTRTIAAHMNTVYANNGEFVTCSATRVLGLTGSSGSSTGPHTHFQVYYYGNPRDDDPYAGDCGGPQSFWTCQNYNEELCGVPCP